MTSQNIVGTQNWMATNNYQTFGLNLQSESKIENVLFVEI